MTARRRPAGSRPARVTREGTQPPRASEDESRAPMTRGLWLTLAAVLAVALAVRLVFVFQIRDHPLFTSLTADPAAYYAQALAILEGDPVPPHAYFHSSPLYPFFLALVSKLFGEGPHVLRLVQSLVGTLSVYLLFVLARLTVGRREAVIAAALAALYMPFVFFAADYLEITLVIAFLLGSLILLVLAARRGSAWHAAAAGALLGLAGLGKPNLLLFAPVGALALVFLDRPTPAWPGIRRRLVPAVLFFVATGLVILPATIHNYRAEGDFIPVSSNGGINLFIGNNSRADGVFSVPPDMRFDLRIASRDVAQRATGRELTAGEVSAFWSGEAYRYIRSQPGDWLRLLGRKFALFWNHYEIPNHYQMQYVATFAPVLSFPLGAFAVVAPLGLLGLAVASLTRRRVRLLIVFGLTFMISVLPFFITGRYRLAVAVPLLVGAGVAVTAILDALLARRWRWLVGLTATLLVLSLCVNVDLIEFNFAGSHNTVGAILGGRGDIAGAAVEFERALEAAPFDLSARYNLGTAMNELGQHDEAARHFRVAIEGHPRYHEAWIGLGRAFAGLGRTDDARETWTRVLTLDPPPPLAREAAELLRSLAADEASAP